MNSIQSSGFAVDKIKSMMIFHTCDAFTVWRFYVALSWRGGTTGRALDLRSTVGGSNPNRDNLGQVVHTCVPLSPNSITWYRLRGGDALRLER